MIKLPSSFELDRYGLHVRLVREDDAEFIVKLRTSEYNSQFLHETSANVEEQVLWLQAYKRREDEGSDYYFVFEYNGKKVGVARLYGIDGENYTHGSWVFVNEAPSFCAVASAIICREIAFNVLGLLSESNMRDGIDARNKNIINFQKLLGMEILGERMEGDRKFLYGKLTKESYEKHKPKVLRFIPKDYQNL